MQHTKVLYIFLECTLNYILHRLATEMLLPWVWLAFMVLTGKQAEADKDPISHVIVC